MVHIVDVWVAIVSSMTLIMPLMEFNHAFSIVLMKHLVVGNYPVVKYQNIAQQVKSQIAIIQQIQQVQPWIVVLIIL
jgi:hypothetical protein